MFYVYSTKPMEKSEFSLQNRPVKYLVANLELLLYSQSSEERYLLEDGN